MFEEGMTPAVDRRTVLKSGALAGALAALAGVSLAPEAGAQDAPTTDRADISIVVVSHGQASDPFWSILAAQAPSPVADLPVCGRWDRRFGHGAGSSPPGP